MRNSCNVCFLSGSSLRTLAIGKLYVALQAGLLSPIRSIDRGDGIRSHCSRVRSVERLWYKVSIARSQKEQRNEDAEESSEGVNKWKSITSCCQQCRARSSALKEFQSQIDDPPKECRAPSSVCSEKSHATGTVSRSSRSPQGRSRSQDTRLKSRAHSGLHPCYSRVPFLIHAL